MDNYSCKRSPREKRGLGASGSPTGPCTAQCTFDRSGKEGRSNIRSWGCCWSSTPRLLVSVVSVVSGCTLASTPSWRSRLPFCPAPPLAAALFPADCLYRQEPLSLQTGAPLGLQRTRPPTRGGNLALEVPPHCRRPPARANAAAAFMTSPGFRHLVL